MTTAFDPRPSSPAGPAQLVAFATPGLCIGALAVAVGVYLPRYYASHFDMRLDLFGLRLSGIIVVGMAFGAVRLIDTLLDMAIGFAMDHTRTRLGRYRVWIAAGAPLLMLPVFMLFNPQGERRLRLSAGLAVSLLRRRFRPHPVARLLGLGDRGQLS